MSTKLQLPGHPITLAYNIQIAGWTYWARKGKDAEWKLFVGSSLLVKSKNFEDIHNYLLNQLPDET